MIDTIEMKKMEVHPLCRCLPPMSAEEYAELDADIAINGVLNKGYKCNGMILDGFHRNKSAISNGKTMKWIEVQESDAASLVASLNIKRRHLSKGQKACASVSLLEMRQQEIGRTRNRRNQYLGKMNHAPRRASEEVAKEVGVSSTHIVRAKALKIRDPKLFQDVLNGVLSLTTATCMAGMRRKVNPKIRPIVEDSPKFERLKLDQIKLPDVFASWEDIMNVHQQLSGDFELHITSAGGAWDAVYSQNTHRKSCYPSLKHAIVGAAREILKR